MIEIESALKELGSTDEAYKIVGNIIVHTKKEDLKKDLEEKKKIVDLRISNLEKQEEKIRERSKKLQEEVMGKLE